MPTWALAAPPLNGLVLPGLCRHHTLSFSLVTTKQGLRRTLSSLSFFFPYPFIHSFCARAPSRSLNTTHSYNQAFRYTITRRHAPSLPKLSIASRTLSSSLVPFYHHNNIRLPGLQFTNNCLIPQSHHTLVFAPASIITDSHSSLSLRKASLRNIQATLGTFDSTRLIWAPLHVDSHHAGP